MASCPKPPTRIRLRLPRKWHQAGLSVRNRPALRRPYRRGKTNNGNDSGNETQADRPSWRPTAEQLLRLLDNTDELDLPVCIEHRDKPDFVLSTRHLKIGLETSSFTDEEVMRADHLHFTRFPKAFITTTGLRDGASDVRMRRLPRRCSV